MNSALVPKEIALFLRPHEIRGVHDVHFVNYRAKNQIRKNSPVEIVIPGSSADLVLLSHSRLHTKLRILNENGTPIGFNEDGQTEDVSLQNLIAHTIWRQIDLQLNGQIVSPNISVNYPYKAYIDVLVDFTKEQKEGGLLEGHGFYRDRATMFDSVGNTGHVRRNELTEHGQIVDFEAPLFLDVCKQNRAILNGVEILIKAYQSADEFRLFTHNEKTYQVEIIDCFYRACHIKLDPAAVIAINEQLKRSPAIYPLMTSSVKAYTIPSQSFTYALEDLFNSYVPAVLYVTFVTSVAYSGDFKRNPFHFRHFKVNYLDFSVDGKSVPGEALTPNFTEQLRWRDESGTGDETVPAGAEKIDGKYISTGFVNEFMNFCSPRTGSSTSGGGGCGGSTRTGGASNTSGGGAEGDQHAADISRFDFANGYAVFAFRLKHYLSQEAFSKLRRGYTRLNLRFAEALDEPVTVLVYGQFENQFEIDLVRNVAL